MTNIELSNFYTFWNWFVERFILFFTWTNQITIGNVSLLKISIGLTVVTIVFAVVLPILRTSPVSSGLGSSRGEKSSGGASKRV